MIDIYQNMLAPFMMLVAQSEYIYVPDCIGLQSHWPFYDVFKDWLCSLTRVLINQCDANNVSTSIERCVINLIHEVPLPPPGKLEISIHLEGMDFFCSRPPVNSLGGLKNVPHSNLVFIVSLVPMHVTVKYCPII